MTSSSELSCRMYRQVLPSANDLVSCKITEVNEDLGVYVQLLEYASHEALIPITEISRRRIKSMRKMVKVGDHVVALVLRVDKDKGHVDLSKAKVQMDEIPRFNHYNTLTNRVHSIVRTVSERCSISILDLYDSLVWNLYNSTPEAESCDYLEQNHAFARLSQFVQHPDQLRALWPDKWSMEIQQCLLEQIGMRLNQTNLKLQCDVQVTCFSYHGIDGIISALKAGLQQSVPEVVLHINVVVCPSYVIRATVTQANKELGLQVMKRACEAIEQTILECQGEFQIKTPVRVINAEDEEQLKELYKSLEKENQQIDGDTPELDK